MSLSAMSNIYLKGWGLHHFLDQPTSVLEKHYNKLCSLEYQCSTNFMYHRILESLELEGTFNISVVFIKYSVIISSTTLANVIMGLVVLVCQEHIVKFQFSFDCGYQRNNTVHHTSD